MSDSVQSAAALHPSAPSALTPAAAVAPATAPASSADAAIKLPPVVRFEAVSKVYGGDKPFTAIKDVSFEVQDHPERGEFVCILGPSGCGKSTILRMIAGLAPQYPSSSGQALVFGKPIQPASADRGMVFQDYTSFDHLSVLDNIAFGLECRGIALKERREQAMDWVGKVGLNRDKDALKYPHQLSGGMRQRVAIARTLILNPRIILMDEPFGALDPGTRLSMQELLLKLWSEQKSSVFFITHSIEEAVFLGDQILVMSPAPGRILEQRHLTRSSKSASEAQRDPAFLEEVFALKDQMEKLEAK